MLLEIGLRAQEAIHTYFLRLQTPGRLSSPEEYWATYDPDLRHRGNPRFLGHNSDGLRDYAIGPKAGRFRLLFLGDSVGYYGDNYDDTFVGHLRIELRRQKGLEQASVINACMKGYSNYQEVLYLRKYGVSFQPDLVGVEFCLNDLHRFSTSFMVENGRLVPGSYRQDPRAMSEARSWLRRLASKSYLLVWLKENVPTVRNFVSWQASSGFSFDYSTTVRIAWQDKPWEDIEKQLGELVELGKEHHFATFLVVVVPMAVQYNAEYLARNREYVLKPQRKLREICSRLQIPFYDFYHDMNPDMFVEDGLHLKRQGRQVMGQKIAGFLMREGMIPLRTPKGSPMASGWVRSEKIFTPETTPRP